MSSYQELKKANPRLPILVREGANAEARLLARYDFGVEEAVSVEGLDKAAIAKKLEALVKKGESMPRCMRCCCSAAAEVSAGSARSGGSQGCCAAPAGQLRVRGSSDGCGAHEEHAPSSLACTASGLHITPVGTAIQRQQGKE